MSAPGWNKGQVIGPYAGSLARRAIKLIQQGVTRRPVLAERLGVADHTLRHHLRWQVDKGVLWFKDNRYNLTEFGEALLEGKG